MRVLPWGRESSLLVRHNALTMRPRQRPGGRVRSRPWSQGAGLALGSATSGVLAYVFFATVTRSLGSEAAAPVSVLWSYWSLTGAALTFPLQHWIARTVVEHRGELSVREMLPRVAVPCGVLAGVATAASLALREQLFRSGEVWFPLMIGAVTLGSALMGVSRGVLSARGRFGALASGLVAENLLRCVAALLLVQLDVVAPVAYGVCLPLGFLTAACWPSAWRLARSGTPADGASPLVFLGGASGGQLAGQVALTGGPVVLALAGGSATQVTVLFAALALFRAPYTLALGVVAPLTGRLTALVVRRERASLRRVEGQLVVGWMLTGVVAALLGGTVGPPLLAAVFGADVTLSRELGVVLAVGSSLAMANLVAGLLVLAHGRARWLAGGWAVAFLPAAAWLAVSGQPLLERTCVAFLLVELAAFVLLVGAGARGTARLAGRDN